MNASSQGLLLLLAVLLLVGYCREGERGSGWHWGMEWIFWWRVLAWKEEYITREEEGIS